MDCGVFKDTGRTWRTWRTGGTSGTGGTGLRSFSVWTLLLCCLTTGETAVVSVDVEGVVGGNAVLPCVYSEAEPLPANVSVYWRDKDDRSVLDIVRSSENNQTQDQRFRGRVSSFPRMYVNGNFSLEMKNLRLEDQGPYECEVLRVHFKRRISLKVSGKPSASTIRPPTGAAADWSTVHHLTCALLLIGFTLF